MNRHRYTVQRAPGNGGLRLTCLDCIGDSDTEPWEVDLGPHPSLDAVLAVVSAHEEDWP